MSLSSSSASSPAAAIKRACDSCHRRKVKCIPIEEGSQQCKNCISSGLNCTFFNKVKKKGPKGSRAKVLSEIRETQKHISPRPSYDHASHDSRSVSPSSSARSPGLLTAELLEACTEYYFTYIYPILPILQRQQAHQALDNVDRSIEAYCIMASLCAYVLLQPQSVLSPDLQAANSFNQPSSGNLAQTLVEEAIRVRQGYDGSNNPSIWYIITSFFLSRCQYSLDRQDAAWIHLREAMTVAHVLGLQDEDTYKPEDVFECSMKRKLFWVLFITERVYAFKRHRPLSLYNTIQLPDKADETDGSDHISGFVSLIHMYRIFDDAFFQVWNRISEAATPAWISQLQRELSEAVPVYIECTEAQSVDLKISQQWLKAMVWQLALSQGFVSHLAADDVQQNGFILGICQELVIRCNTYSHQAMEVHGLILAEKLFDVAFVFIDAMSCMSFEPGSDPRDCLNRLIDVISTLSSAQARLLPILSAKMVETFSNAIHSPYISPFGVNQGNMQAEASAHRVPIHAMGYESQPTASFAGLSRNISGHQYHGQDSASQFQGHFYSDMVSAESTGEAASEGYSRYSATQGVSVDPDAMASGQDQYPHPHPHLPPGTGYLG